MDDPPAMHLYLAHCPLQELSIHSFTFRFFLLKYHKTMVSTSYSFSANVLWEEHVSLSPYHYSAEPKNLVRHRMNGDALGESSESI